jgi:site-specific DNA-cytosine methylase
MLRIVQGARPRWVIAENVAGIASMALNQMVSDLETCGYEVAEPVEIPACAVGHDHRRARYWFLAHSDSGGEPIGPVHAKTRMLSRRGYDAGGPRTTHGVPSGLDRHRQRAIGNAVCVDVVEQLGNAILQAEQAEAA